MDMDLRVLESCCLEWYQNTAAIGAGVAVVLESCCLEWYQNPSWYDYSKIRVL
ncbi:hypothetical protein [Enterococcus sp. AZ108]|uniref:hypothetical protein n=1 Tax=Enterococcus sp. AZ108 TaxID=2774725 RepID=UPI003F6837FB